MTPVGGIEFFIWLPVVSVFLGRFSGRAGVEPVTALEASGAALVFFSPAASLDLSSSTCMYGEQANNKHINNLLVWDSFIF